VSHSARRVPAAGDAIDVFKALADPIRLSIVSEMTRSDEVACTTLEHMLPITKTTISYHIKVLYQAGLITIRKQGRNYFYSLRRETMDALVPGFSDHVAVMEGRWQPS
jgi:DNA-binding transcriptional ArsR family regulator